MNARARLTALQIAYVAVCAATVTAGKLALSALPNVEVVTLLLASYGYVFGPGGVLSAFVFCGVEMLIWGVGSWVILYFVYWPLLALVFALLGKAGVKNRFVLALIACAATVAFGVLSSLIDTGLFTGFHENFWSRFALLYARGAAFYVTQIVCNAALFILLFSPLTALLKKMLPAGLLRRARAQKTRGRGGKIAQNTFNCLLIEPAERK